MTFVVFFLLFIAGEISLSRSIAAELVSGYELYISVSDGRNVIASRTLSVRITGA